MDWREDRIGAAARGENPTVLASLDSGYAVIGDVQFLPGYSVLLSRDPSATALSELPRDERLAFLADVDLLGTAVEDACRSLDRGFRRMNIEILGNTDAYIHAHLWPRYDWEPADLVGKPVWLYDPSNWADPATALSSVHDDLRAAIVTRLDALREGGTV
ncbi:HIT family protein [Microbacterium sp. EST19A]|uniref:HIT family protein n=1 Tax=Microbacterium sp. EST19A TaxID=2862681 RepID=UPI001CBD68A4|nr:diadenosine tetraphosphate hydrolase [Microbacterium sp. EST19A]